MAFLTELRGVELPGEMPASENPLDRVAAELRTGAPAAEAESKDPISDNLLREVPRGEFSALSNPEVLKIGFGTGSGATGLSSLKASVLGAGTGGRGISGKFGLGISSKGA
jgi:hypothetical protein